MSIKDIYIVGGMCSGKTSLANGILGKSILPIDKLEQSEITIHYNSDIKDVQAQCIEGNQGSLIRFSTMYDKVSKKTLQKLYDNPQTRRIELYSNYPFLKDLKEKPIIHIIPTYYVNRVSEWKETLDNIDYKSSLILYLFDSNHFFTHDMSSVLHDLQFHCNVTHEEFSKRCLFICTKMENMDENERTSIINNVRESLKEYDCQDAKIYPLSLSNHVEDVASETMAGVPSVVGLFLKDAYGVQLDASVIGARIYKNSVNMPESTAKLNVDSGLPSLESALQDMINTH